MTAIVATDVSALPDLDPGWSGPLTIEPGMDSAYFRPQTGDLSLPSVGDSNTVKLAINETIERLR